jgi:hypothetical protein
MIRLTVVMVALALTACTPAVKRDADWVRAEFAKEEAKGSSFGDVLSALREGQPDIYVRFIDIAGREIIAGKSPYDAGLAARPVFAARFAELAKTAKDEQINGMLQFAHDQYRAALEVDPELCLNIIRGKPDLRMTKLSPSLTDRELALMASVFRAGKQDGAAAPLAEVQDWMGGYAAAHPDVAKGLQLMAMPAPTTEDARAICLGNIGLLEGMLMQPPETSARMFRGLLALT